MVPFHLYLKSLIVQKGLRSKELNHTLGYTSPAGLSNILSGKNSLSMEKAILLEKAGIGTAKSLMTYQLEWEFHQRQHLPEAA